MHQKWCRHGSAVTVKPEKSDTIKTCEWADLICSKKYPLKITIKDNYTLSLETGKRKLGGLHTFVGIYLCQIKSKLSHKE